MRVVSFIPSPDPNPNPTASGLGRSSAVNLANLTGFLDLIVPAGFTGNGLPVGLSAVSKITEPMDDSHVRIFVEV